MKMGIKFICGGKVFAQCTENGGFPFWLVSARSSDTVLGI